MRNKIILFFVATCAALAQTKVAGPRDIVTQSAPASPASGTIRVYGDSGTGKLACKDSAGADCMPAGGSSVTVTLMTSLGATDPGTWWNSTGCNTPVEENSTLRFDCNSGDSNMHGRMQAVSTSGNWAYAAAFTFMCNSTDCNAGVFARNTGGAAPFIGIGIGNFSAKSFYGRIVSGTGNGITAGPQDFGLNSPITYACIGDNGTTMTAYASVDGKTWQSFATNFRSTLTSGADQVGLAFRTTGTIRVWKISYASASATCPAL